MANPEDQNRAKWHVGKEVPLVLVVAIVVQSIGLVIWLRDLSNDVKNVASQMQEFKVDRYTKDDGRRDRELLVLMNTAQAQRDREQDRRIDNIEQRSSIVPQTYRMPSAPTFRFKSAEALQ